MSVGRRSKSRSHRFERLALYLHDLLRIICWRHRHRYHLPPAGDPHDLCPWHLSLHHRGHLRSPWWQDYVPRNERQGQPNDRCCWCFCRSYGGPCRPQNRSRRRPRQLPSHACDGTATLATKRSSAEYIPGQDPNQLVIVPYANPFRLYELGKDYASFKSLFENKKLGIDCYIINTGSFLEKKVKPADTLGLIEDIVLEKAKFVPFGPFSSLEYYPLEGFEVPFKDPEYLKQLALRMEDRLEYVSTLDDFNKLPQDAIDAIKVVVEEAKKAVK